MSRSRDIELGKNLGDTITRLGLGRGGKTRTLYWTRPNASHDAV